MKGEMKLLGSVEGSTTVSLRVPHYQVTIGLDCPRRSEGGRKMSHPGGSPTEEETGLRTLLSLTIVMAGVPREPVSISEPTQVDCASAPAAREKPSRSLLTSLTRSSERQ
eukprot:Protomagalhaensia_wolfi_Nauph_80__1366@NODE_1817_length_1322_cov_3_765394_g1419_i0_p2_GENE_NODE_1817_length_1322_cov_3_765394_g1419_i0NODE_1817_length_1322_cov_3_765394_g1419_i0_p2_ORF_typecomplete_len110_score2_96_NODE_1817_length_1322_cov_3_765394_g1419_i092421